VRKCIGRVRYKTNLRSVAHSFYKYAPDNLTCEKYIRAMKKIILIPCFLILSVVLISWGFKGHRAVATIAEKHLDAGIVKTVSILLQGQNMAAVSTWADENRDSKSAPWHYINLPLGLNHDQFVAAVKAQGADNVYGAILATEAKLQDKNRSQGDKNEDLKYLIHLIGDAHQPMHVSGKEDKGGNTIQLRFDGKGTNLHSLWDSRLIDHEGINEAEIPAKYDQASAKEIKSWLNSTPMDWIWESYQISSVLYGESKSGQEIDEAYYQKYIQTIHKRINQAGIRLSGELNRILKNVQVKEMDAADQTETKSVAINIIDINNFIGKQVSVRGKVYGTKDIGSMVLVSIGAAYPDQLFTLALKGTAKEKAADLDGKTLAIEGTVIDFKGKPEIVVSDPELVKVL